MKTCILFPNEPITFPCLMAHLENDKVVEVILFKNTITATVIHSEIPNRVGTILPDVEFKDYSYFTGSIELSNDQRLK